jgi:hypothetical protein
VPELRRLLVATPWQASREFDVSPDGEGPERFWRQEIRLFPAGSVSHRALLGIGLARRVRHWSNRMLVDRVVAKQLSEWTITINGWGRRRKARDLRRRLDAVGYDLVERTRGRKPAPSAEARRDLEHRIGRPVRARSARFLRCRFVRRADEAGSALRSAGERRR